MGRLLVRAVAVVAIAVIAAVGGRALFAPPTVEERVEAVAAPQPRIETVTIHVAARDLAAGTFLDVGGVETAEVPRDDLPTGVLRPGADPAPVGAVIIQAVAEGTPLRKVHLLLPGQDGFLAAALTPGMRAVSIAVDAVSGNAGHVFPGDMVDLILTQEVPGHRDAEALMWGYASETVLECVRVIAVDQDLRTDLATRGAAGLARTVTLEVTPAQAELVAVAGRIGALALSLRSLILPETVASADDTAVRGPTWAADISAVVRAAARSPAVDDLPPLHLRQIRVMRGSAIAIHEN